MDTSPIFSGIHQALGHDVADKRLEVLRLIGLNGSISEAARQAGISYKAAWQALDTLTTLSGAPLVDKTVGGAGGGGARLTAQGEALLALAGALQQARAQVIDRFAGVGVSDQALGMRTSMRNQVPARVLRCERAHSGDPVAMVHLQTACGAELCSAVTQESLELLGLVPGLSVLLLCKATAVTVSVPCVQASHGVMGRVERVNPGVQKDEVVLKTQSDALWVGFADARSGWQPGQIALASMSPSALVIGLPA